MRNGPSREQLIDTARTHILGDAVKFSLAGLSREMGCPVSAIRRHFPAKADLVTAVFSTNPAPVDKTNLMTTPIEDDWVERRLQIFERAIATLEERVEKVRQENVKSVAQLEKKLDAPVHTVALLETAAVSPCVPAATEKAEIAAVAEQVEPAHVLQTETPEIPPLVIPPESAEWMALEPPPQIDLDAGLTPTAAGKLDLDRYRKLLFTTTSLDAVAEKDGRRKMVILGTTIFAAALGVAGLVIALTSHAGASYAVVGPASRAPAPAAKASSPQPLLAGHIAVKPDARTEPLSKVASLMAKTLILEKPLPAANILLEQAGQGNAKAQAKLALAFFRGDGVAADPVMAAFWSEAGAQQGDPDAQYLLAHVYSEGIKPDPVQAFRWFSSAALHGNTKAMHNLAIALLNGVGVAKDPISAANWFAMAANRGYRDSAFDLGVLFERGEGVAQNSRAALSWYDKAAGMGDQEAAQRAALLRSDGLSPAPD